MRRPGHLRSLSAWQKLRPSLLLPLGGAMACASILGLRQHAEHPFAHRAHAVRGIACVACHAQVTHAPMSAPADLPSSDVCAQCHQPAHERPPCGRCHGQALFRQRVAATKRHLTFSHTTHSKATSGACTRCHGSIAEADGPLTPAMATCFSCHVHKRQWSTEDCNACHRDLPAEQSRPTSHVVHGPDFMADHGAAAASARDLCSSCHTESECASCHGVNVAALPNVLRFERVTNSQLHRAGFAARHRLQAQAQPGLCMTCHTEDSCRQCHGERDLLHPADPRHAPHPPGWVGPPGTSNRHGVEARRDPMACASCHGGAGEQLCVNCHRSGGPGGNPHPPGFSSTKPLSERPCRQCHGATLGGQP